MATKLHQGLYGICGLSDETHIRLRSDDGAQPFAKNRVSSTLNMRIGCGSDIWAGLRPAAGSMAPEKRYADLRPAEMADGIIISQTRTGVLGKYSCEFADLFGAVPAPLSPYLPSFRHALVDLALVGDLALSTEVRLRAFLKALKYSRRADLPDCIDILLAEAPALDEKDLFVILTYLDKGPTALNNKVMHEALLRLVPDRTEQIMGWLTQPYYDKGKA